MALPAKVHNVRYSGGAQSILTIPVDSRGVPTLPSSATYGILDLRYPEDSSDRAVVATSTAGSIDSASTTTSAAAGAGQSDRTLLAVADGSSFTEGHAYLLTDATTNRREVVYVERKATNNLYIREPLRFAYATSSTLQGIEVTATFPSAEAADEDRLDNGGGPYAIDWTWVGVDPTAQRELVWVKRNPERVWYVTAADCARVDPNLPDELRNYGGGNCIEQLLIQAHDDFEAELRAVGIDPANFNGGNNAGEFIKHRWAYRGRTLLPGDDGDRNDRVAREHFARSQSLKGTFITYGKNPIGTVTPNEDEDEAENGTSTKQPNGLFALT